MKYIAIAILFLFQRIWVLVSLGVVAIAGILLWRYYEGPAKHWVNYYLSCVFYEVFWCLVVYLFWPGRQNAAKIAIIVFLATCVLEALQLWEAQFLEQIRATFIGKAFIGTDFVWQQFPYYVIGSFVGWLWLRLLAGRNSKSYS